MAESFNSFSVADLRAPDLHRILLHSVSPRPIAFASTVDKDGNVNLAPFSFFNTFSINPPLLIFAPNRSGRTGKNKDTVTNILETFEVVINTVSFEIVEQCNLASTEYPTDINEFEKAGLTPIPSTKVKPPRVLESPVQIECLVKQVISLGSVGSSGQLILCEPVWIHIAERSFTDGVLDPNRLDLVARMGGNFYCRASGQSIFELAKPGEKPGIGIDALPDFIKKSHLLTGNELAKLGGLPSLPTRQECELFAQQYALKLDLETNFNTAKHFLQENQPSLAIKALLFLEPYT